MAGARCIAVQARPTEFLNLTSLTLDEFQRLVPPFEAAFQAHMRAWRLDGKPRTTLRCTANLPAPAGAIATCSATQVACVCLSWPFLTSVL
jgi:hypothetical protein